MKQKSLNQQNLTRRLRRLLVLFAVLLLPFGARAYTYLEYSNGSFGTETIKESEGYTMVLSSTSSTTRVSMGTGWYILGENAVINAPIEISGHTKLLLCDGCTLTASQGIVVPAGSSLTIYGQTNGTGTLIASARDDWDDQNHSSAYFSAAIGGSYYVENDGQARDYVRCGSIYIHGGQITADASNQVHVGDAEQVFGGLTSSTGIAAGIGGCGIGTGSGSDGGIVEIYGGTVTAIGSSTGAGIGGGYGGNGGTVKIYGGTVTATGGSDGSTSAQGIGAGNSGSDNGTLTLYKGVTCYGDDNTNPPTSNLVTGSSSGSAVNDRYRYMNAILPTYDLIVAGVQVTEANGDDIFNDGTVTFSSQVSMTDGSTYYTLTLDGATLTDPIEVGLPNLTIDIKGTNSITTSTEPCLKVYGTPAASPALTFKSTSSTVGTLTLTNTDNVGVSEIGNVTVSKELAPMLTVYETDDYTSYMYYFTDGSTSKARFVPSYGVKIDEKFIYAGNATDFFKDGTVSFDQSTHTLTLNNASTGAIGTSLSDLTIEVVGNNTLSSGSSSTFESLTGDPVTVTIQSTATPTGCLRLNMSYSSSNVFAGNNVTLNIATPLDVASGDLNSNTSNDNNVMISELPGYDLVVNKIPVVAANASSIIKDYNGRTLASFDASTNTLTFDGYSLNISSFNDRNVVSSNINGLKIKLVGDNTIEMANEKVFKYTGSGTSTLTFETDNSSVYGGLSVSGISSVADMLENYTITNSSTWEDAGAGSTTSGWKYTESSSEVDIWYQNAYDLTVAGTTVTSRNMDDILGSKNVSFTPDDGTNGNILTLNGATLTGGIVNGLDNLTIYLKGENVITGANDQNQLATGISSTASTATLTFTSDLNADNTPTGKLLFPYVNISIDGFASCDYNSGLDFISLGEEYTPAGATGSSINVNAVTNVTYFEIGTDKITSANRATASITPAGGSGTISYDASNRTLTLDGVNTNLTINSYIEQDLTVAVKGTNSINTTTGVGGYCINSNISRRIKFIKGEDDSSLTLTSDDGHTVLNGFVNSTLPDLGSGINWVPSSQTSAIVTTNSSYILVGGYAIASGQTINGTSGNISYTVSGSEKILTLNNYVGSSAIETGIEGLTVKLIGTNTIDLPSSISYAFVGLQTNASIGFVREDNGNLTITSATSPCDGFSSGNITYDGLIYYQSGDQIWSIKRPSKPQLQNVVDGTDFYTYATIDYADADKFPSSNTVLYSGLSPQLKYSFDYSDASLTDITNADYPSGGIKMTSPGVLTAWVEVGTVKSEEATGVRFGSTENPVKVISDGYSSTSTTTLDIQPSNHLTGVTINLQAKTGYSFDDSNNELSVPGYGKDDIYLTFSKSTSGDYVILGDSVKIAIEATPSAPTIAFDANKTYLDTDEIGITNIGYTTIFYTWGDPSIGTEYTHSADNPTLTELTGTGVTAQTGTLKAWAGYALGNNSYLLSPVASQAFTTKMDIASCPVTLPVSATYTGSPYVPIVKASSTSETELTSGTDYTVSYKKVVGTDETGVQSMVDASTYKITFTGIGNYGGTKEVTSFHIGQATPTLSFSPTTATITFGNESAFVKPTLTTTPEGLTVTYGAGTSTIAEVDGTTGAITPLAVGDVVITATFAGNDNYISTSASYTLTVAKGTPTITKAPTAKTLTYTSVAQALVEDGTVSAGTLVYSNSLTGTFTESIPEETNAGTYPVYYKVNGNANYNGIEASESNKVMVTISPATITDVTLTQTSLPYSGAIQTATISAVKAGNLTLGTNDYNITNEGGKDVGTYYVTVTGKDNFTGEVTKSFEIVNRTLTVGENGDIQFADGQTWASFYSTTESLELPEGIMAYIVTAVNSTSATVKAIKYVPKNVPVFLEKNSTVTTTNSSAEGNLLKGTTASTPVSGISGTVYALHNNLLMQVTTGSIPTGRCYLEVNNASGARKLSIIYDEGGSTSIQSLKADEENDADEWYTMDGRKLQKKPTKEGLYIKNGKKVVINRRL
ncbi:MAG: hypothetical protein J6W43_07755 [Prevotella sp.]|nr:hypothetical protein [Prevotella sp.]